SAWTRSMTGPTLPPSFPHPPKEHHAVAGIADQLKPSGSCAVNAARGVEIAHYEGTPTVGEHDRGEQRILRQHESLERERQPIGVRGLRAADVARPSPDR